MSLQPLLLSRWLARPVELLQRTSTLSRSVPSAQPFALLRRQPFLRIQAASQTATQRSMTTTARYMSRITPQSRPGLSSIRLPKRPFNRRFNSGSAKPGAEAEKEGNSLSARLRKLSREYGWAALGVYLGLSALDFPFCFVAVRLLGVDRIGHFEHVVVGYVKSAFPSVWPQKDNQPESEGEETPGSLVRAEEANQAEASIWTQLALAYAIHKSFIFIRVPLTAAVTPKVVKVLRRWGWDIGKRKPKSA
ncbi:hypothetical protein N7462_006376 [Penicillium macrosclerotiorum]|uniref:uncharacterized protein n=1 Tax=Penicillium macrosclerotiorum TaxID=303699 RepID=UPI00254983C1|nr:uncharacterized protein N7462_006376 [Penicillium macrosclerotiorum]KAJ5683211.1 hypothetical protein N7462_006376 [Penicillium macrosclerotiorum]